MTTWPLLLATFVAISLPQLLTADPIDQVRIRAWGENALRIQIAPSNWTLTDDLPTAYLPVTSHHQSSESGDPIVSGNIKGEIDVRGMLRVTRLHDSKVLFQETARSFNRLQDSFVTFDFSSVATKLYGMGQNRHQNNGPGLRLNVINETYSFQSSISEEGGPSNSLPFTIASSGSCFEFGVLFNSPTLGSAMFNATSMTWSIVGEAGNQFVRRQFDFLVTTHAANASNKEKPFQIVEKYVDAVGHARKQPYAGYWHSRNRYKSQDELLEVARGFHNRSIPVDVIVIDYHHWKIFGDWSFDERYWPDPQAMVDECRSYGIEIMVSVWPFTCPGSRSYDAVMKNGWFTSRVGADGKRSSVPIETHGKNCRLVDPTNPDFRKYIWSLIETGYYNYGIKIFWLDASEPEGFGPLAINASWSAGNMRDMASMFTLYWSSVFYDGLRSHNENDIVMLPRSGWVGTWRYGAVLWSGDIGSTMDVLKSQVNIGLSAQISGIPWWTTDIGGYNGGNAEDPMYRETIVRWFQYGFTCPLFRQHGARDHTAIWFYGSEDEKIIGDLIKLRASMKDYFTSQFDLLNETGRPFNRPLCWDFPEDPMTWILTEQGIGDPNSTIPAQPGNVKDGDFVVLESCRDDAWNQRFVLDGSNLKLADEADSSKCIDNGGSSSSEPPTGPYPVHMWDCKEQWSASQTWAYNAESRSFYDAKKERCLSFGDGTHPAIASCNASDPSQQFAFDPNSANSTVISNDGSCLTVVPSVSDGGENVCDQYMMGNDYMAAPVLNFGQRSRRVYFPRGANWEHHYTKTVYKGGTIKLVDAPLDNFPLFKKI